jgi:hypothetical protein
MIIVTGYTAWTGTAWGPIATAKRYPADEAERLADAFAEQQRAQGKRAAELAHTDEVVVSWPLVTKREQ